MKTFTLYLVYFIWCCIAFGLANFLNLQWYIAIPYLFFVYWFSIKKVFPFLQRNFSDTEITVDSVEEDK